MLDTHELLRNGPYLRVTLPDVLPPDWDALESDLDLELEGGVVLRATILAPRFAPSDLMLDAVFRVASLLGRHDVRVRVEPKLEELYTGEVALGQLQASST